jgi:hypothetical protein
MLDRRRRLVLVAFPRILTHHVRYERKEVVRLA